jgi:hypothetical protein
MSSPFRSAGIIIARSIAAAMKQHGGKKFGIDPTVAARSLWLESHPRPVGEEESAADVRLQPKLRPRPDRARFRNRHRQSGGGSVFAEPLDSFEGQIQKPQFLENGSQRCKDLAVSKFVGLDEAVYS